MPVKFDAKLKELSESAKNGAANIITHTQELGKHTEVVIRKVSDDTRIGLKNGYDDIRLKMLNPMFEESLSDPQFRTPKLIYTFDYDKRMTDPLCNGAIGFLTRRRGESILNLHYDQVPSSGFKFLPSIICGALYYTDPRMPNIYVDLNTYFAEVQKAKCSELERIAYELGAKKYLIQLQEDRNSMYNVKANGNQKKNSASVTSGEKKSENISIVNEAIFETPCEPQKPELVWYKGNQQIENLIAMRCGDSNHKISVRRLELEYQSSVTMTMDTAVKLDTIISEMKFKTNFTLKSEVEKAQRQKLIFNIEF